MGARVLIVDDEPKYLRLLEIMLRDAGYDPVTAPDGTAAIARLDGERFDAVLTDLQMPGADGLAVLARCREIDPDLPVLLVSAYGTVRSAVDAMRQGAFDFVEKPFDDAALQHQLARAVQARQLTRANRALRTALADAHGFHRVLGNSRALRDAIGLAERVAASDTTVLLLGESGTGKELFARAIHEASARATGPFVKLNCAAIPATLLEAELFGVERGAFTGADRAKPGRLEQADGGTLFLDEIGELDLALQPKLLRALEERTVERLGAGPTRVVDVRFVAATNRELEASVRDGAFRLDLYHRLAVFPIRLPPLRERLGDVPTLVQALIVRFNEAMGKAVQSVSPEALTLLGTRAYPGNVRELANVIERAMILTNGAEIQASHIVTMPGPMPAEATSAGIVLPDAGVILDEVEATMLRQAMTRAGGNKTIAARLLGLTRNTLRYRLEKHGIV